jgi:hypothetical protein
MYARHVAFPSTRYLVLSINGPKTPLRKDKGFAITIPCMPGITTALLE